LSIRGGGNHNFFFRLWVSTEDIITKQAATNITAVEGRKIIQKEPRLIYIDVRSEIELLFVGYSADAVNIP
jgi:hypothetical protein